MPVTFYVDAAQTIVDQGLLELNRQSIKPVTDLADGVSDMASFYWGNKTSGPEPAQQKVEIPLSYLRIKDEPTLDSRVKAEVEDWLQDVAWTVAKFSLVKCYTEYACNVDNKLYWGALALTATGLSANDPFMFDYGLQGGYYDSSTYGRLSYANQLSFNTTRGVKSVDLAALEIFLYLTTESSTEYKNAKRLMDSIRPQSRQLLGDYTSYLFSRSSVFKTVPLGTKVTSPPPPNQPPPRTPPTSPGPPRFPWAPYPPAPLAPTEPTVPVSPPTPTVPDNPMPPPQPYAPATPSVPMTPQAPAYPSAPPLPSLPLSPSPPSPLRAPGAPPNPSPSPPSPRTPGTPPNPSPSPSPSPLRAPGAPPDLSPSQSSPRPPGALPNPSPPPAPRQPNPPPVPLADCVVEIALKRTAGISLTDHDCE
eukprot:gene24185-9779_t